MLCRTPIWFLDGLPSARDALMTPSGIYLRQQSHQLLRVFLGVFSLADDKAFLGRVIQGVESLLWRLRCVHFFHCALKPLLRCNRNSLSAAEQEAAQ